ncbi:MAG: NAD(P)-dependent glycerol-3-phosphate dehydrogenase [Oscillospiraceae bacterium]|nr:NAD(P)-dependent glycerol-3-phosphate dehydrogenase [Oscillospiraceae bacterium]
MIMGSGGWGTAMAVSAAQAGHRVSVWSPFPDEIKTLQKTRENPLLPGIRIPETVAFTGDVSRAGDAGLCIIAVPSFAVGSAAALISDHISKNCVVVSISKGFDKERCERLSEIIRRMLPENKVVALTGPSHAEEVARKVPTVLVSASESEEAAVVVREALATQHLRIYSCGDIIGAELGGAVKNVIALSTGIADGMGMGDNTKAALMTRGLREIRALGLAMGAQRDTFGGLSGMGDLVVTCTSMHSRNRRAGMLIGQGRPVEDAIAEVGTVEGYHAAEIVRRLAQRYDVDMPICRCCYEICYEGRNPRETTYDLMTRPAGHEEKAWGD